MKRTRSKPRVSSSTFAEGRSVGRVAQGMRRTLLAAARHRKTITYGTLMRRFRLSRGRVLSVMIGVTDRKEYASGAPGFAALIVRKDTGYPGGGYFCDEGLTPGLRRPRSRGGDPHLSKVEKNYIRKQQERIWEYYEAAPR